MVVKSSESSQCEMNLINMFLSIEKICVDTNNSRCYECIIVYANGGDIK